MVGIVVLGMLWACMPRSPEAVDTLAARAEADPAQEHKLVAALAAKDTATWERAFDRLVVAGDRVRPELREAVQTGEVPLPGRATLVLGTQAHPDDVPWLRTLEGDREVGAFAREALRIAERTWLDTVRQDPSLEHCTIFLEAFPDSESAPDVAGWLRERSAERALEELGEGPAYDALVTWYRSWSDTDAAEEARPAIAGAALLAAGIAIAEGRPHGALGLVAEARTWDDEVDATEIEAAARNALGLQLATMSDLDGAIAAMEEAISLGGSPHPALVGLYLTRARQRLDGETPVGALQDLRRADELETDGHSAADLGELASAELVEANRELPRLDAAVALLIAGSWARDDAELLVADERAEGHAAFLRVLMTASAASEVSDDDAAWASSLLESQHASLQQDLAALLRGEALAALLGDPQPWASEGAETRDAARHLVSAWLEVSALKAREDGGSFELPDTAALHRELERGADPRDEGELERRAALVQVVLAERDRLVDLADSDPARLAAALAHADTFPHDAVEQARLALRSRGLRPAASYGVPTEDGPAQLKAWWAEGGLEIELAIEGTRIGDDTVAQCLRVLFGAARPVLGAHVAAAHLQLTATATLQPEERLRVKLTRIDVERMNWALIGEEAPFTAEHLALVLDHERTSAAPPAEAE